MKCPYCGEELEQGTLTYENGRELLYLPAGEACRGLLESEKSLSQRGGILLDGPHYGRLGDMEVPAAVCRVCRKIILTY